MSSEEVEVVEEEVQVANEEVVVEDTQVPEVPVVVVEEEDVEVAVEEEDVQVAVEIVSSEEEEVVVEEQEVVVPQEEEVVQVEEVVVPVEEVVSVEVVVPVEEVVSVEVVVPVEEPEEKVQVVEKQEEVKEDEAYDSNPSSTESEEEKQEDSKDMHRGYTEELADTVDQTHYDIINNLADKTKEFRGKRKDKKRNSKRHSISHVIVKAGGFTYHEFEQEEIDAFTALINYALHDDKSLKKRLPLKSRKETFFNQFSDGVILCKLINKCEPGSILDKIIKQPNPNKMNYIYKAKENVRLALNTAKSIGIKVIGINPEQIVKEPVEQLVLGLLWQFMKKYIFSQLQIRKHPLIVLLCKDEETLEDLMSMTESNLLLRWIKFHLMKAKSSIKVKGFSKLKDGKAYTVLLNQLNEDCSLSGLKDNSSFKRMKKVLDNALKIGATEFLTIPTHLTGGDKKVNMLFAASLFLADAGLDKYDLSKAQLEKINAAKLLAKDMDPRDERLYKNFINSLGIKNCYINNLRNDLCNGLVLLRILDHLIPGTVNWKIIDQENKLKKGHKKYVFQTQSNCQQAISLAQKNGIKLINIQKTEIAEKNMKQSFSFLWQLVRFYTLQELKGATDRSVLKWANKIVPEDLKLKSFKSKSITNCKFLFYLLNKHSPGIVDYEDIVSDGNTAEDKNLNARYVLSVARSLGCVCFLTPEDIVDRNKKLIFTLVAGIQLLHNKKAEEMKLEKEQQKQ